MFSTSRDQQQTVRIRVCQGESRRIDDNVILGDLVLEGLPPRPRGETAIEVTFQLDADGILRVRARDAHTGQEQRASLDLGRRAVAGRGRRRPRALRPAAPIAQAFMIGPPMPSEPWTFCCSFETSSLAFLSTSSLVLTESPAPPAPSTEPAPP